MNTHFIQSAMEIRGAVTTPIFQLGKRRQKALVNCLKHMSQERMNQDWIPSSCPKLRRKQSLHRAANSQMAEWVGAEPGESHSIAACLSYRLVSTACPFQSQGLCISWGTCLALTRLVHLTFQHPEMALVCLTVQSTPDSGVYNLRLSCDKSPV